MAERMTATQIANEIDVLADTLVAADDVLRRAIMDDDIKAYLPACGVFMVTMMRLKQLRAAVAQYKNRQQDRLASVSAGAIDRAARPKFEGLS